jgi:dolichol-phosphate hexosyltransferase
MKTKKVTVVIPCFNEVYGIAKVINGFDRESLKHHGYDLEVLVIDNQCTDDTAEVARKAGARVITEKVKGKGNAMRTGFRSVSDDTDFVIMIDGDDTYSPGEVLRMLEPLQTGFCDVIIGSRLGGKMNDNSMSQFNRLGNWIFSLLVRYFYRVNVTDVLTGYFAWKKQVLDNLTPHLVSNGFAIEMEMITKMARLGYDIYSVPISYHPRKGQSNLRPLYDGYRILKMFFNNIIWRPAIENIGLGAGGTSQAMNIVFVSDAIYPYNKGGKEKRLYELSTRLAKLGHDVHIYTMHWWSGTENTRVENGVTLHAISKKYEMYKRDRRSISEGVLFALNCFKL